MWHNWQGIRLSIEDRNKIAKDVESFLLKNPKEPYYFISTGDGMIIGFNWKHEDGTRHIEIDDVTINRSNDIFIKGRKKR